MTMRITIKNEDAARVAHFTLVDRDAVTGITSVADAGAICAGETREVYLHGGRYVTVTEAAGASVPKP